MIARVSTPETGNIEVGDQFISRNGRNIVVVVYLSTNNDVGYRHKWTRRVLHTTAENFRRNYTSLSELENPKE